MAVPRPSPHADTRAVLAANDELYRAFESYDLARLDRIWVQADRTTCMHPSWQLVRGWKAVRESFVAIFAEPEKLRFTLTNVGVQIRGDLAWVTLCENISSGTLATRLSGQTMMATNILERGDDSRWRVVHHHASPMPKHNPR